MPRKAEWVSGNFGDPIELDTKRTDLAGKTWKIEFFEPDGTLHSTKTATNPSAGLVSYILTSADATSGLLVELGEWRLVPRIESGSAMLRQAEQPFELTVKAAGAK